MKKLLGLAVVAVATLALMGCKPGGGEGGDPSDPVRKPVTKEVTLGKLKIVENHPWENGAQNMDVISNYQTMVDITSKTGVLKKGDSVVLTWKGVSDIDIDALKVRLIDDSADANWWKELEPTDAPEPGQVIASDIKAGVPFEGEVTMTLGADAVSKVAICVWYEASVGSVANITEPLAEGEEPKELEAYTLVWNSAAQWAAPVFTVGDDWVSLEVEFMTEPDASLFQFCVDSDSIQSVESWGTSYFCVYRAAETKTTIVVADCLKELVDNGATKITYIKLQNKTTDAQEIAVKSSKVTKADGSVVDVVPTADWGSKVF